MKDAKGLYLYLAFAIENANVSLYRYVRPTGEQYDVAFYKAVEMQEPNTVLYVGRVHDDPSQSKLVSFYVVSDDKVLWEAGNRQPIGVKNFVERLMKLFPFM